MALTREEAWNHLCEWTKTDSLRKHARAVEIVMRAAAHRYGEGETDEEAWGIAGMLMVEGYDQRDPAGYATPAPMTALSYKSRLVDLASSGEHYDVRVDEVVLRSDWAGRDAWEREPLQLQLFATNKAGDADTNPEYNDKELE